ncbi:metal-dependent hydrolase [Chloroflexota bacterium]
MFIFGHVGLTLGIAKLLTDKIKISSSSTFWKEGKHAYASDNVEQNASGSIPLSQLIDVRILVTGALLPDIIDKPLGVFILKDIFGNGRIFSHSLLFLLIIALSGLVIFRCWNKIWLLTLSFGVFAHLAFDEMWLNLPTLLWPLMGLAFKKEDVSDWIMHMLEGVLENPHVYLPEIIGFIITIWFLLKIIRLKELKDLVTNGRIL